MGDARRNTKHAEARKRKRRHASRRISWRLVACVLLPLAVWMSAGGWFVHHPRKWIERHCERWPAIVTAPLLWIGGPVGDITDALGLTGHDAVYEYDEEAPAGSVFFAGAPQRVGPPAPADIVILDRGEFKIGWSPSLRHPLWVAYHVPKDARYPSLKRPGFRQDRNVPAAPAAGTYSDFPYDRGHMAPNYAMSTRFGPEIQGLTFLTSNIAPQSPTLNRGVWREVERRIADFWTARYGEIWVIVGAIPSATHETLGSTGIDLPSAYWQVVVAQEGLDVRALALLYTQDVKSGEWPARGLISIDELEAMTGLDFLPELPEFIQSPLEAELPSRLWPVRALDLFRQLKVHYDSP